MACTVFSRESLHVQSGDDIIASTDGEVTKHKDGCVQGDSCQGLANMVAITAPDGTVTQYGHMTKTAVSMGQQVKKGDKLGTVGSTGFSSGPHLHFDVIINGKHVDGCTNGVSCTACPGCSNCNFGGQ
jgi:murein DD-endopeptidase MepM/ murein hydrolase activator NlpD